MKNAIFALITLAVLVVPLANAQVYTNPWESGAAQYRTYQISQNIATCGGYCSPGPANPYGGAGYYGGAYGVGGGRVARDVGAGLMGAGIGGAFGGRNGAIVGGIAGVGIAELGGYLASRGNRPLDCVKRKLSRDERYACEAQQAEAAHQQGLARQQAEAEHQAAAATRWLFNRSGQQVVVTDGGRPVCNSGRCFMRPAENWQINRPTSGQWVAILEVPKGSGMVQLPGEVRSVGFQGWEITAPPKEVR